MTTKLAEGVYWVGYVDNDVRDFHGYRTDRGSTYNAYLVVDDKAVLIDTVKTQYSDRLLEGIREVMGDRQLDMVVCNHAEPDHSGSLPAVMAAYPSAELVCDAKCEKTLGLHYDTKSWQFRVVADGDSLSTGCKTLSFMETPMVHWPESMFTFLEPDKILFSMDAFGQHFASEGRYDADADLNVIMEEAKTYYANIVMLYGKPIAKVLDRASHMDIKLVAPSHGIMWRENIADIVGAYMGWVVCKPEAKVLVMYDTMWGSTEKMAEAIAEGAREGGAKVKVISVRKSHITEIATEALDTAVFAFGSSTLNMGLMPEMAAALTYLKGLRPVGKLARAFGSYGWGKGGPEDVNRYLEEMKCDIFAAPLKSQFVPGDDSLAECRTAGKEMAAKAIALADVRACD